MQQHTDSGLAITFKPLLSAAYSNIVVNFDCRAFWCQLSTAFWTM